MDRDFVTWGEFLTLAMTNQRDRSRDLSRLVRVLPKVNVCDALVLQVQEALAFLSAALKMYREMNHLYNYYINFGPMTCLFLAKASEVGSDGLLLHGVVPGDRLLHDTVTGDACYDMTIRCTG